MSCYSCPACGRPWLSFWRKLSLRTRTILTCPNCHQQARLSFLGSIIAHLVCAASPIPAALVALLLINSFAGQTLASLLWLIMLTALATLMLCSLVAHSLVPLVSHAETEAPPADNDLP